MPFIERTKEKMREEFVKEVLEHKKTKSELCIKYGISRPTGDKWIKQYLENGSLADKSRAPHKTNRVSEETEQLIINKRTQYLAFGAVKIKRILHDEGYENLPCDKTINNIFHRNGLITKEASIAATPYKRFEKSYPNEMWQGDYKGHFEMKNGIRCHPLNIEDDYSRFNICCKACLTESFEEIKPIMIELFEKYGLPFSFLCDNGNPWGTSQSVGFTKFEVWLMELGILTLHGRVHHPQTQGKSERFNGSFTRECLNLNEFYDINDAQKKFDKYRNVYNNIRPHHALNLDVPSSRYKKSNKEYPSEITAWEYPEKSEVRKVKSTGYFNYESQGYFLSEAFAGKEIAIKKSEKENCINLFFRQFKIARINIDLRAYEVKKIYLINGDPRISDAK